MNGKKQSLLFFWVLFGTFLFFSDFYHLVAKDVSSEKNKICLTMIVRNESKIIERCMDSVIDIVDCISICDTGSTDDTVQIIEKYIKTKGLQGKVHRHEWKNFGHNRTLSVEAAQKLLAQLDFPLDKTYLLLLDADMLLEISPQFHKDSLQKDAYQISQKTDSLVHYNTRLIRASLPWKCLGVTHEYWACMAPSKEEKLETLTINDRNDGGCKADKFERDVRLLTQGLKEEPNNERYLFYLARSHHCLNNYEEAIKWYQARIEKGGWKEEVWYSKYMIGNCYEDMNQWDKALSCYLDAYQFNPERAETIQQISKYYRLKEQYDLAYLFAKQGSRVPYPSQQILFISYPVYDYLFDEDLSVAAYYTPFKEEGYAATNRLMLKKNIPQHIRDRAYKNMLFYVQPLKNASYQPIKINLPPIREGYAPCYNPMNPTIKKTEQGYDLICRTVNYTQIGATSFQTLDVLDPTNTVKTKNFFVQYDRDFNLLSQHEIVENLPRKHYKFNNVEGLEDCRLVNFNGSVWFTCTTGDTNPCSQYQISLCKLENERSGKSIQVEKLIPLMGPNPHRCEKNWLPFVKDNELHAIYSYDPFIVYKLIFTEYVCTFSDDAKKDLYAYIESLCTINNEVMTHYKVQKHDFSRFSGSAAPIELDDGYLIMVHETVYDGQRYYMHRFVFLDRDFNITKVSKPFIFLHKGIEYCCGMTVDHSETKLVMSIGIEDREAYLCSVDLDTVHSLLEPLANN